MLKQNLKENSMNPKEKAQELYLKYYHHTEHFLLAKDSVKVAIQCAIIAVEEIIEEVRDFSDTDHHWDRMNFWMHVLNELKQMQ